MRPLELKGSVVFDSNRWNTFFSFLIPITEYIMYLKQRLKHLHSKVLYNGMFFIKSASLKVYYKQTTEHLSSLGRRLMNIIPYQIETP